MDRLWNLNETPILALGVLQEADTALTGSISPVPPGMGLFSPKELDLCTVWLPFTHSPTSRLPPSCSWLAQLLLLRASIANQLTRLENSFSPSCCLSLLPAQQNSQSALRSVCCLWLFGEKRLGCCFWWRQLPTLSSVDSWVERILWTAWAAEGQQGSTERSELRLRGKEGFVFLWVNPLW